MMTSSAFYLRACLCKQALAPLPPSVRALPDLLSVFGHHAGPLQSVQVSATQQRRWVRLVGQRTDLHLWQPDSRQAPLVGRRKLPAGLKAKEAWVQHALEHVGLKHLGGMALMLLADDYSDCPFALRGGRRQTWRWVAGAAPCAGGPRCPRGKGPAAKAPAARETGV